MKPTARALQAIAGALAIGSDAIARILVEAMGAPGRIAIERVDLAKALARRGCAIATDNIGDLDGVVLAGIADDEIAEIAAAGARVRRGGLVAVVAGGAIFGRGGPPVELAAAMIHAGLVDIATRRAGASWILLARRCDWR